MWARMLGVVVALATLAYPAIVYVGVGHSEPLWVSAALLALALLRAWVSRQGVWMWAAVGAALLAVASVWQQSWVPLKLYPLAVNVVMFALFTLSLFVGKPVVERIARLTEPDLPPEGVAYTRKVTRVWCCFFVVNGALAATTALWASDKIWALYNGLIAYILMGLLFGVEWLVRRRVRSTKVLHG